MGVRKVASSNPQWRPGTRRRSEPAKWLPIALKLVRQTRESNYKPNSDSNSDPNWIEHATQILARNKAYANLKNRHATEILARNKAYANLKNQLDKQMAKSKAALAEVAALQEALARPHFVPMPNSKSASSKSASSKSASSAKSSKGAGSKSAKAAAQANLEAAAQAAAQANLAAAAATPVEGWHAHLNSLFDITNGLGLDDLPSNLNSRHLKAQQAQRLLHEAQRLLHELGALPDP